MDLEIFGGIQKVYRRNHLTYKRDTFTKKEGICIVIKKKEVSRQSTQKQVLIKNKPDEKRLKNKVNIASV